MLGSDDTSADNRHVSCASCNTSSGTRPFSQVIVEGLEGRLSPTLHPVSSAESVVSLGHVLHGGRFGGGLVDFASSGEHFNMKARTYDFGRRISAPG
jgi:hypothetical protein